MKISKIVLNDTITGYYDDLRISQDKIPEGYYKYSVNYTDDFSDFADIKFQAFVNHAFDFITRQNLDDNLHQHDGCIEITSVDYDDADIIEI